jgi:hypothetical protein
MLIITDATEQESEHILKIIGDPKFYFIKQHFYNIQI